MRVAVHPRPSRPEVGPMGRTGADGHRAARFLASKKCAARTRSGADCAALAVRGRERCRMHGSGVNADGRGSGAPAGNANAEVHGFYGREAKKVRKEMRALL